VRMRQLDRWRLRAFGLQADDLELYGFEDGRNVEDGRHFLGYSLYKGRLRPALNSQRAHALTENKWVFYRLASAAGLPVPRTLGLFDAQYGSTWDGRPLLNAEAVIDEIRSVRPDGLVFKPAGGQQGYELSIIRDIDHNADRALTLTGEEVSVTDLVASLGATQARGYGGFIIQERVDQHQFLDDINPYTANTARIVTLIRSSGEVEIQFAILRLGRRGNMADNWEQGGISVALSDSGELQSGLLKPKHGGRRVSVHPDTGVEFKGLRLPMWEETLRICRQGARAFTGVRWIGWDLLLTPDGPVILEANSDWDLQMVQVHSEGLLARPEFRAELASVGVEVPDRLPGLGPTMRWAAGRAADRALRKARSR
jgi:hypothetical protein